jgi:toxin ParE1/3/4
MPAEIVWSPDSLDDVVQIVRHIGEQNPSAAEQVASHIRTRTRQLEQFPLSGRHYDMSPRGEIRELVVPPYRIFYRPTEDLRFVRILRVWHSARGMPELPRK